MENSRIPKNMDCVNKISSCVKKMGDGRNSVFKPYVSKEFFLQIGKDV